MIFPAMRAVGGCSGVVPPTSIYVFLSSFSLLGAEMTQMESMEPLNPNQTNKQTNFSYIAYELIG